MIRFVRLVLASAFCVSGAAWSAGCSGSASVQIVSLHATAIDPPDTKVWTYPSTDCYWRLDEAGRLNIAMTGLRRDVLVGRLGDVRWGVSLVLDKLPAGSGRNYVIRSGPTRVVIESVLATHHLTPYAGIVAVMTDERNELRGSFRLWMRHRPGFSPLLFLGPRSGNVLVFGTFRAVQDSDRARAIRDAIDKGGWSVPVPAGPATSRPTAAPLPDGE